MEEVVETTAAPATNAAPVVASLPEFDLMASAVTGTWMGQLVFAKILVLLLRTVRQNPCRSRSEVHVAVGAALLAVA